MGVLDVLRGSYDQTDPTGYRVIFAYPPLLLASGRPSLTLSFGDGTADFTTDNTGKVTHTYTGTGLPQTVVATLTDADGGAAGRIRFQVPRVGWQPYDLRLAGF